MQKIIIWIVCFFSLAITINAQIKATIVDFKTKAAIYGATVDLIKEGDSSVYKKTTSKTNGSFEISNLNKGKYFLNISHVGYSQYSLMIDLRSDNLLELLDTIWLKSEAKNLETVNVTNKKPPLEFVGNKFILNVNESPILSSGSAYEAVTKIPGVIDMNDAFKFRGKSVLVLIDNKKTFLAEEDLKEMLLSMPANNIEKIEVLSMPSTNYDASAQSIINIKTIKNKYYGMNGVATLGIGIGKEPRYNGGINFNYRKSLYNLYGSYSYEHTNTYLDVDLARSLGIGQQIFESSHELRIRSNNLYKMGIDIIPTKKTTIGISYNGFTNHRGRTDYNNVLNTHGNTTTDSLTKVRWAGKGDFINSSLNLYLKQQLDTSGQTITINGDYVHYSKNPYDNYTTDYFLSNGQSFFPTYLLRDTSITKSNVYSATVDYTKPFKNGHFDAGIKGTFTENINDLLWQTLSGNKWEIDSLLTQDNKYNENIYAGYLSADKSIGKYEITAGLRYEETNLKIDEYKGKSIQRLDFGSFFPNLGIEYKKNDNNVLNLSYRKSVLRPTFRDLSPWLNYYSQYSYYTGNPNLRPQYDHDFNLSYSYKNMVSVSLEYTHTTDAILSYVFKGADNILLYGTSNISFYNLFGLSVSYSKQVNKIWYLSFSNTLQYLAYSQDATDGLKNNGITYAGDLKNSFTFKNGWSGEIYGNYNSASPFGIYRLNNGFLSGIGAGLQKTVIGGKGKIVFSATDILNTSTQKYSTDADGIYFKKNDKLETRYFRLVFNYKFGNKNVKSRTERKNSVEDIKNRL